MCEVPGSIPGWALLFFLPCFASLDALMRVRDTRFDALATPTALS